MMKNFNCTSFLLVTLFLAAACSSDRIHKYEFDDRLAYNAEILQKYQVDQQWWELYQNAELNKLVQQALTNNPDYIKAALTIEKELYRLNLATLDLFPTLHGDLGVSTQSEVKRTDNYSSNFSGELGLNYEVDLYGKIRDLRSAQAFEYQAVFMDRQAARLSLINSVTDLYFNLEYLQNAMALTRKNIEAYQNIEQIMSQKYQSGRSDELEFLESKQSVLTEKNKLLQLETQFKEMETSLKNIVGVGSDQEFVVKYGQILNQKTPKVDLNVPLGVLARRPDLSAAQYRLESAFKQLKAEEKNWYPSISLNGAVKSSSGKARTTFDFPFLFGSVGVDLPFLDWNRVKNNVKISEADYKITVVDFQDTLTQALNETAYYMYAYEKALQTFKNVEQNYNNAVKITAYYQKRYNNGKIEFRDYLDAINRENSLRQDLINQKYMIIKYENYLFKAMGGYYR